MPANYYMYFITALIPLIVGFVYYSDTLFGKPWKQVNKFSDKDLEGANMAIILGTSYFMGLMLSLALGGMVIHQTSVYQMMIPEVTVPGSAAEQQFMALMKDFGNHHRGFSHGALHGGLAAVFFVLPLIAINALFERRGWKYIFIHLGYWFITLLLMGGVLCQTLVYE